MGGETNKMRISFACNAISAYLLVSGVGAFVSTPNFGHITTKTTLKGQVSEELGLPCEDECALESYPNMPESVHPGVLSGKSLQDLIEHARENGRLNPFEFAIHPSVKM